MKKFSKFMALSMALALTFGMTVFADNSATDENRWANEAQDTTAMAKDSKGESMPVTVGVTPATVEKAKKANIEAAVEKTDDALTVAIKAAASEFGTIKTPQLITVIDINVTPVGGGDLPEGAQVTVTVPCTNIAPAKAGFKYVLMHLVNGTTWEAVSDVTIGNGYFTFVSGSFSNYALFLVEEDTSSNNNNGSGNSNSNSNNNGGTTTTQAPASEPVSPKTGESVPVAGFAALILLAGAAVCAKKVQLNN